MVWAMSEENIERYRRAVDAWNRGDVDEFAGLMDDAVEVHTVLGGMEGAYRGHEGVHRLRGQGRGTGHRSR